MQIRIFLLLICILASSVSQANNLTAEDAQVIAEKCLPQCAKSSKIFSESSKLIFKSSGIINNKNEISKKSTDLESTLSELNASKSDSEIRFTLNNSLLFSFDNSELKTAATEILEKVLVALNDKKLKGHKITVEGHTCWIGTDAYNLKLSEERAASVKSWFIKNGVNPAIISTAGYGESKPTDSNENEEGRSKNRRVEIVVAN